MPDRIMSTGINEHEHGLGINSFKWSIVDLCWRPWFYQRKQCLRILYGLIVILLFRWWSCWEWSVPLWSLQLHVSTKGNQSSWVCESQTLAKQQRLLSPWHGKWYCFCLSALLKANRSVTVLPFRMMRLITCWVRGRQSGWEGGFLLLMLNRVC